MQNLRRLFCLIAFVLTATVAACGSDNGSNDTSDGSLVDAAWNDGTMAADAVVDARTDAIISQDSMVDGPDSSIAMEASVDGAADATQGDPCGTPGTLCTTFETINEPFSPDPSSQLIITPDVGFNGSSAACIILPDDGGDWSTFGSGQGLVRHQFQPGLSAATLYTRAYYWLPSTTALTIGYLLHELGKGAEKDQLLVRTDTAAAYAAENSAKETTTLLAPTGKSVPVLSWVCVQSRIDNMSNGKIDVWVDGSPHISENAYPEAAARFTDVSFGVRGNFQMGLGEEFRRACIDEIAVSTDSMPPCL